MDLRFSGLGFLIDQSRTNPHHPGKFVDDGRMRRTHKNDSLSTKKISTMKLTTASLLAALANTAQAYQIISAGEISLTDVVGGVQL